jgi:hypothetical protein
MPRAAAVIDPRPRAAIQHGPGGRAPLAAGNAPGRFPLSAACGQLRLAGGAGWQRGQQVSPGQDTGGRPA